MDNFTLAVVIGIAAILCTLLGLVIADKGAPDPAQAPKSRKKKSS